MKRTTRLEQVEQLLLDNPDGLRVVELSAQCGVDRRTIYRDLEEMQNMGLPVWQKSGRFGIEREQYFTSLRINLNEAFALLWALRFFSQQTEMEYPPLVSLLKKLAEAFPPELSHQIEAMPPLPSNPRALETIEEITHAWADGVKAMIWFRSGNKTLSRVIAPYLLDTNPQGKLYVIGMDEETREIRALPLSRIIQAKALPGQPFKRPSRLDHSQYSKKS
jgi:predicted DNA-binding transcriptional regulator YafY